MFHINNRDYRNHLLFRDYLTKHRGASGEYAQLKLHLAARFPEDREAYLDGKASFVQQVLAAANGQNTAPMPHASSKTGTSRG